MTDIPVLLLGYLRLDGLKRVFQKSLDAGIHRFYIAIDGPKNDQEAEIQREIYKFLEEISYLEIEIHIWKREINLGIAVSVITAIDWFFLNEDSGIILEDDLDFNSGFIEFVSKGLLQYRDDPKVWIISGNNFLGRESEKVNFCNYPQTWGWSTWRDRWINLRNQIVTMSFFTPSFEINRTNSFWKLGSLRVALGEVDTWDIPLAAMMKIQKGVCCLPPVNLVKNVGVDSFSTHTTHVNYELSIPVADLANDLQNVWSCNYHDTLMNNKILERRVFHFKIRHYFLPVKLFRYYIKIRFLQSQKRDWNDLQVRINQVQIPKSVGL